MFDIEGLMRSALDALRALATALLALALILFIVGMRALASIVEFAPKLVPVALLLLFIAGDLYLFAGVRDALAATDGARAALLAMLLVGVLSLRVFSQALRGHSWGSFGACVMAVWLLGALAHLVPAALGAVWIYMAALLPTFGIIVVGILLVRKWSNQHERIR